MPINEHGMEYVLQDDEPSLAILKHIKQICIKTVEFLENKERCLDAGYSHYKHYRRYNSWNHLRDFYYLYLDEKNFLKAEFEQCTDNVSLMSRFAYRTPKNTYFNALFSLGIHGRKLTNRLRTFARHYFPDSCIRPFNDTDIHSLIGIKIPTRSNINSKDIHPLDIMNKEWLDILEYINIDPYVDYDVKFLDLGIRAVHWYGDSDYENGKYAYKLKGFNILDVIKVKQLLRIFMENPKKSTMYKG